MVSTTNTANYVQPLSVPTAPTIWIAANDPRNNKTYLAKNPNVKVVPNSATSAQTLTISSGTATVQNKFVSLQASTIAPNANTTASTPVLGSVVNVNSTNLVTSTLPTSDQLAPNIVSDPNAIISASSPVYLSNDFNDPLANILLSDYLVVAQPPSAVPPPTFALDAPENLYIDSVGGFRKATTSDGSVVYTASLIFDDVDGADPSKYNTRVSIVG